MAQKYTRVSVKNGRRLLRKLRAMPEEVRADIGRTLEEAGQLVEGEMKSRVPTSEIPSEYGHIRDQITHKLNKRKTQVKIGLMGRLFRKVFFYGRFLEFGTRRMRARKFVHPSLLAHQERILADVGDATRKALNRVSTGNYTDV